MNECEKAHNEWFDATDRHCPSRWEAWQAAWEASDKNSQEHLEVMDAMLRSSQAEVASLQTDKGKFITEAIILRSEIDKLNACLAAETLKLRATESKNTKLKTEIERLKAAADTTPEPEKMFVGCTCDRWQAEYGQGGRPVKGVPRHYERHPEEKFCTYCGLSLYRERKKTVIPYWVTLHRRLNGVFYVQLAVTQQETERQESFENYSGQTHHGQFVVYEDREEEE